MSDSNIAAMFYWLGWLIAIVGLYLEWGVAAAIIGLGAAIFILPIAKHSAGGSRG